ncbi:hypothetical protein ACFFQF_20395 [Haladaptatus pallidirubidus]|uniref:hypothetical protein n=1 Tax=Haladaptatus pallidirubidus TaxID=1008152 RepID=UPI001D0F8191|nr:hypothetical protein [Haladaptatus pallidirubidus]
MFDGERLEVCRTLRRPVSIASNEPLLLSRVGQSGYNSRWTARFPSGGHQISGVIWTYSVALVLLPSILVRSG